MSRHYTMSQEKLRESIEKRNATMIELYGVLSIGQATKQIEMVISPWFVDDDGCMTRTIRAAE